MPSILSIQRLICAACSDERYQAETDEYFDLNLFYHNPQSKGISQILPTRTAQRIKNLNNIFKKIDINPKYFQFCS